MSTKALLVLIVMVAFAAALLVGVVSHLLQEKRVKHYEQAIDSMTGVQSGQDLEIRSFQRAAAVADSARKLDSAHAVTLTKQLAVLKAKRQQVDTLMLPDTGSVPVAIVRAAQDLWRRQLALADSARVVAEDLAAAYNREAESYNAILVQRTNELVAEHLARQQWEHLAKAAPVRPPKLLGFLPMPKVQLTLGGQAGYGACLIAGVPQPCMYAGLGGTVGVGFSL